jgi:isopenicillin N synthase-like dioxygenase
MDENIPTIDLNSLNTPAGLRRLDKACSDWGFFYLVGHSIDDQRNAAVLQAAREFFEQPQDTKNQIRRSATNSWGFYDAELTKNRRDWKEILDIGPAVATGPLAGSFPQWPAIDGFADLYDWLSQQFHGIALSLVSSIGRALDTDEDLQAPFVDHSSYLRINYYPACEQPAPADSGFVPDEGHLGISHHTDAGAVTVLLPDDVASLQVYQKGRFHTVAPVRNALIINVGDIVQVWSNDKYQAPLHRVLTNLTDTRISIPYFLNPSYDYSYAPLSGVIDALHPARYRPINWGEFRAKRSAGDYADLGKEVQIAHYALKAQ